jgi:hypothetical protein
LPFSSPARRSLWGALTGPDGLESTLVPGTTPTLSERSTSEFSASSVWGVSMRFRLQIGMIPRHEPSYGTHTPVVLRAGRSLRAAAARGSPRRRG